MAHSPEKPHRFFAVALDVQYKILCRGVEIAGGGRTTHIGSKGLVFIANGHLPKCERIEVSLLWPAELPGRVRLKLVIRGRVSERDGNRIAVAISSYEFYTRAASPQIMEEMLLLLDHAGSYQNRCGLEG